jgi:hypothetical protein
MASLRALTGLCLGLMGLCLAEEAPAPAPDNALIEMVLDQSSREEVAFRTVVERVTGHRILPVNSGDSVDHAIVEMVTRALNETLVALNAPDSPVKRERRINEVSRYFEESLQRIIDADPDFECAVPVTQDGQHLTSGYPDRRIVHLPSGRITYIDPKLVEAGSTESTFRTFYFTPRTTTNKIREDAHHLLVGILHDGQDGNWTFLSWKLVDLYDFHVRLKAEYQAGNKDLYRKELILRSGP